MIRIHIFHLNNFKNNKRFLTAKCNFQQIDGDDGVRPLRHSITELGVYHWQVRDLGVQRHGPCVQLSESQPDENDPVGSHSTGDQQVLVNQEPVHPDDGAGKRDRNDADDSGELLASHAELLRLFFQASIHGDLVKLSGRGSQASNCSGESGCVIKRGGPLRYGKVPEAIGTG